MINYRLSISHRNNGSKTRRNVWYDNVLHKVLKSDKPVTFGASNVVDLSSCCVEFDGADDLNNLKILRMMATPAYILARYITTLEISNALNKDIRSYTCGCSSESDQQHFHFCPANNKFVPFNGCREHIECVDPISNCFDLSQMSSDFAKRVPEYGEECKEITDQVMGLSVQLLDHCCNTNEVELLLGERSGLAKYVRFSQHKKIEQHLKHPRLIVAVELNHKEFVSHMYCQQILRRQWHGGVEWEGRSLSYKVQ